MEARIFVSLQTNLKSRVPVAVGVHNGEVVVVCPGGREGEVSSVHVLETSCTLCVYKLHNPHKEVRTLWPVNI